MAQVAATLCIARLQRLLQDDQIICCYSLTEVGEHGFLQLDLLNSGGHILKGLFAHCLLGQGGIVLDPGMLEGLIRCIPLLDILLDEALQELLGLRRVS